MKATQIQRFTPECQLLTTFKMNKPFETKLGQLYVARSSHKDWSYVQFVQIVGHLRNGSPIVEYVHFESRVSKEVEPLKPALCAKQHVVNLDAAVD